VFNARFDWVRPQAIVLCASPEDVAETISFSRRHRLAAAVRSGGHCFAGRSSSAGVLIDTTPMNEVSISGTVARVGAGTRLGDLYQALRPYDRTVPGGTCPAVGIAGLTLGGGLGILGRRYGLTSDHLLAAQVVLADGRTINCDDHNAVDLFWALRGGGAGGFGVVTSLVFKLRMVPTAVTNFRLVWPSRYAAAVIAAWQGWAPRGPDELAASLVLAVPAEADQPAVVTVFGILLGGEADTTRLLDSLVAQVGTTPASTYIKNLSYWETLQRWARLDHTSRDPSGVAPPDQVAPPSHRFIKSEFFSGPLPVDGIAGLVANLTNERAAGQSRELDFTPWGGAYNRAAGHATAFVHRDPLYVLKHSSAVPSDASTAAKHAAQHWASESWDCVHRWGQRRVFPNFADPDLQNWADAYYGSNYDRLLRVKTRYDPGNFFRSRQSIPLAGR
jgi:hypothetical protein